MIVSAKNKIILEIIKSNDKSSGGVILPENANNREIKGRVISAGADTSYKEGQVLFFDPAPSKVFAYKDKTYFSISEDDVLGYEESDKYSIV